MNRTFTEYHPVINIVFFVGAIGLSMFMSHPQFIMISFVFSLSYYIILFKKQSKRILVWYFFVFFTVVFFNGIMNTMGNTVLFVWLKNRPVTMEALVYGAVTGVNFVSVMLWFACYSKVMTTDKFIYLFGRFAPAITLVMSMILRLIPYLQKKAKTIMSARSCIGKGNTKMESGFETLSILTSCALEDAIVMADSMQSRGYVDRNHSSYHTYNWKRCDVIAGNVLSITAIGVFVSILEGCATMRFLPGLVYPASTNSTYIGIISYAIFLAVPIIIECSEEFIWHILKSKI